jgi:hypothetical protein
METAISGVAAPMSSPPAIDGGERRVGAGRDQFLFQRRRLLAAADEGDVGRTGGQRRRQGLAVALALGGDDDEAAGGARILRQVEAGDPVVRVRERRQVARQRRDGDREAGPRRQIAQRLGGRRGAGDQQRRARQHGVDENVDRAAAGTLARELGDLLALGRGVGRADADHPRPPVDQRRGGRLLDGALRAAAADPAFDRAVGAQDRLGPGLGRGGVLRAYDGGDGEGPVFALHPGHAVDQAVGLGGHVISSQPGQIGFERPQALEVVRRGEQVDMRQRGPHAGGGRS